MVTMTKTGTDYTDRFDQIDDWQQRTDQRFDRLEHRFSEFIDRVDTKFGQIDQRFKQVDRRFERVGEQLDKLTATMVKGFGRIDKELEKKADKVDLSRALNMLDSMIKRQEVDDQERLVMSHHMERIERWSYELADKIGHKLSSA
jgi:exonuclease VII large subunit